MYYDHMNGTDWVAMGLMMTFWVVLLLVVVWAIAQWARSPDRSNGQPQAEKKSARDILDERYARGEIDKDEYQDRRHTLDHLPAH
jgi:putative membrane protein